VIPANADAIQTPGDGTTSITLLSLGTIALEGATEFSSPIHPLTSAEVSRLNALAPNLGLVTYQLQWVDPHGSVVGPTSSHKFSQVLTPVINTTPNFDTVIQRVNDVTLTAPGQVGETKIKILMLDLQSVNPVLIAGFHYEVLALLANGSAVCDNPCTEFTGNLKFDATSINPVTGLPSGNLDLGITGPTPTTANLGADLPSGMEALPVNFDINFIPLDGGPALPPNNGEVIFQNFGPSSFAPVVPEPGTLALLSTALLALAGLRRRTGGAL
jgi:hypothetical protein